MKNLLKLSLLALAIVVSGINASIVKFEDGREILVGDEIVINNDLKVPVTIEAQGLENKNLAPGAHFKLSNDIIAKLYSTETGKSIPVMIKISENIQNGRSEYLNFPRLIQALRLAGENAMVLERFDVVTYNVSDVLNHLKSFAGFSKRAAE